jgi:uncharacterized lipoprotein
MKRILMVSVLLLAACATGWKKPGASQLDLDSDTQICTEQAQIQVPVQMVVTGGYRAPSRRECEAATPGSAPVCTMVPGELIPPALVDQNLRARDRAIFNCLKTKGWAR